MNADVTHFLAATTDLPPGTGRFVLFGGLHLTILFATAAIPLALALLVRRHERPTLGVGIGIALTVVLLADRVFALGWALHVGKIARWPEALPMHLCDWATFVVVYALLTGRQRAYEIAYFWGLAGTLQAVLTPDTNEQFPNPFFISFFISHCGIIIAVLFMTWGLGRRPTTGSWWRAWGWTQFYALCAGLTNWLAGTNFGYLAAKPKNASLLDLFAPWPGYVLELEVLALALYGLLYLPFWRRNAATAAAAAQVKVRQPVPAGP